MNTRKAIQKEQVPPEHLAEAGVWIARLHGDDRDPELETGFRQWLRADPLNAKAFELTTEVWEDSLNLRRVVPFAHDVSSSSHRLRQGERVRVRGLWFATAAAILLAIAGAVFYQNAGVATGVGEQRLLTLEDGTRVYLNTATRVIVNYDNSLRKVVLKGGEALFDVAKKPDRPFVVQVGDRQVQALGTTFVVRYDEKRTAVTLVEGKVAVSSMAASSLTAQPVVMTPGQRLTFAPQASAKIDTPVLDKAIAWRRGQVVLDDTPLSGAIDEMNRYSMTKLVLEHPEAANLLINGLFQAGDSENFARAIAQTYGLTVANRHGEIALEGLPQAVEQPRH